MRPAVNRVLLPKVGPDFDLANARVFLRSDGSMAIRDDYNELVFSNISQQSLDFVRDAGGVLVTNPSCQQHPKLIHIPLSQVM